MWLYVYRRIKKKYTERVRNAYKHEHFYFRRTDLKVTHVYLDDVDKWHKSKDNRGSLKSP